MEKQETDTDTESRNGHFYLPFQYFVQTFWFMTELDAYACVQ